MGAQRGCTWAEAGRAPARRVGKSDGQQAERAISWGAPYRSLRLVICMSRIDRRVVERAARVGKRADVRLSHEPWNAPCILGVPVLSRLAGAHASTRNHQSHAALRSGRNTQGPFPAPRLQLQATRTAVAARCIVSTAAVCRVFAPLSTCCPEKQAGRLGRR